MTDTILIQGGPMQLVSWDPGSGGTYSVEGINMILGGQSWALELDSSNNSCVSLLPAGAPVPTGPVTPNFCHVGAFDSVRPYGAPCAGCYNVSFLTNTHYQRDGGLLTGDLLSTQTIYYNQLAGVRLPNPDLHFPIGVPEPPIAALLALALAILAGRHVMSALTRRRGHVIIEAQ